MDNMIIKNAQGEQLNINVVRYFRLNSVEYLVFSLNEVDEGGYVKLYISKINGEVANTITDDVEWNLIKDTVKTVIKSNKENLPLPITDLDVRRLGNVQIIDQKVFKLSENFIQLLGANKKVEAYMEPEPAIIEPITPAIESVDESGLNSIQQNPIIDSFQTMEQGDITESAFPQTEIGSIETTEPPVVNNFATLPVIENQHAEERVSSIVEPFVANLENIQSNELDYKTLYENELNKNELLITEIEKYKSIINDLKNVLNQSETF